MDQENSTKVKSVIPYNKIEILHVRKDPCSTSTVHFKCRFHRAETEPSTSKKRPLSQIPEFIPVHPIVTKENKKHLSIKWPTGEMQERNGKGKKLAPP